MDKDDDGPIVKGMIPGSGAETIGIRVGDRITRVGNVEISTDDQLINIVTKHFPGDMLDLTVLRNGELLEFSVELMRHSEYDDALADFEDFIGGKRSIRRTGFARVLQHDTAISHLHCGGPVVDINGRFVGVNIARAARTSSFLLPADEVRVALKLLKERRTDRLMTVGVNGNVSK